VGRNEKKKRRTTTVVYYEFLAKRKWLFLNVEESSSERIRRMAQTKDFLSKAEQ